MSKMHLMSEEFMSEEFTFFNTACGGTRKVRNTTSILKRVTCERCIQTPYFEKLLVSQTVHRMKDDIKTQSESNVKREYSPNKQIMFIYEKECQYEKRKQKKM